MSFLALSPMYHGFITSRPCLCIEINDKTGVASAEGLDLLLRYAGLCCSMSLIAL